MKIKNVVLNNRKKTIEIETPKGWLSLPFAKLDLKPTPKDKITKIFVDSDLASRCVTYRLASGKEDSVHLDSFLNYNQDPDYLRDLLLHKLTCQALELFEKSNLTKNEICRRLKTSPSQLKRLFDPSNYKKSLDEVMRLLAVLGYNIELKLSKVAA